MFKGLKQKKASSIIEYMIVVLFFLAALFVFQNYIIRGFAGRWKAVGDIFGSGRQYDPKPYNKGGTLECFYYSGTPGFWVATQCYEKCLRNTVGFGNPQSVGDCRVQCSESNALYKDCSNSSFSI